MKLNITKNPITSVLFVLLLVGFIFTFPVPNTGDGFFVGNAEAVRGRRASPRSRAPRSRAGVHRRHRRRTIRRQYRRHHYYEGTYVVGTRVAVLPAGCTEHVVSGYVYYYCADVYYQPYYEGNEVVYIIVEDPYR